MLARRDTRYEATRVRRLSPLQTVEDQSQAWGLCCHSCTWREGFAPSWQTELQGSYLPCGLPGSRGFLSTNGSHLDKRRIDAPAPSRQDLRDGLPGAEHHAVGDVHEAPTPVCLDHLRVEQLWQGLSTICQPQFIKFFPPSARSAHDASGSHHSMSDDAAWP